MRKYDVCIGKLNYAWKTTEKVLENWIPGKIIEVHWKSEICIGKWILRKTCTLENQFWDLDCFSEEMDLRILRNSRNSLEKDFWKGKWILRKTRILRRWISENLGFWNLRILKHKNILIWTWEMLWNVIWKLRILRKSNSEKNLEFFGKIDLSEIEIGKWIWK